MSIVHLVNSTEQIRTFNGTKKWFYGNRLSLNLSKTKIMLFGNCTVNTQEIIKISAAESTTLL